MNKFYILILSIFTLISCSVDDNRNEFHFEVLKIESFDVPIEFVTGATYPITVTYKRPTSCHYFNNLYFYREESTRKIGIESIVEQRDNCNTFDEATNPEIEYTFDFKVIQDAGTTYLFKFYKGKDANGTSIFEEVTIPVIN